VFGVELERTMTEKEYIDATNLAKVRAAKTIFRDVLLMIPAEEKEWQSVMLALSKIEDRLTKAVKTTG
jgi:hypothetical protein